MSAGAPSEAAGPRATARLREFLDHARAGLRIVTDIALPPRCGACNRQTERSGAVCSACWRRIAFIERPFCARLGLPFPCDLGEGALSAEAIARPPVFDRARAVASYDGPARELVTALKFRDRTDLVPLMAAWMVRAGAELLTPDALVVPVPLHRRRLLARKHNQAALLANAVAGAAGCDGVPDLLVRTRATRAQIGLSARQREANVRAAFRIATRRQPRLKGRHVVLVDDVFTTGATVTAATRALKKGGVASVDVLTFARVVAATDITI